MNLEKAFHILEIDISDVSLITLNTLKKKYRKLALKHHPDKNGNTIESNELFSQINDAYHYVLREMFNDNTEPVIESDNYYDLLKLFIRGFQYNENVCKILTTLIGSCIQKTLQPLSEDLDRDTCLKIYAFLSKHQSTLHIEGHILDRWREMVEQKFSDVLVFQLNPSISDLLDDKIYKLDVNGNMCFVPLWMRESYFDISGYEVIVICNPQLPENIYIDENNNIHVRSSIDISDKVIKQSIQENKDACYCIKMDDYEKVFQIPYSELYLKTPQIYTLKKKGICVSNEYDVSNKANIVFHIHII
jgi:hypothetical protein